MAKEIKTKAQIVAAVADKAGINKKQAATALEALVALAYAGAKTGFTVPGLGKLVLVQRKARTGRNPATGEAMKFAASNTPVFKAGKAFKDKVNG